MIGPNEDLDQIIAKMEALEVERESKEAKDSLHPGVRCVECSEALGSKIRYKCFMCPNVDLCQKCRKYSTGAHGPTGMKIQNMNEFEERATAEPRASGMHLMVEIPDSIQHKDNESIYSKAAWIHEGIKCNSCNISPIVGERYFCETRYHSFFTKYISHLTQAPLVIKTCAPRVVKPQSTIFSINSSCICDQQQRRADSGRQHVKVPKPRRCQQYLMQKSHDDLMTKNMFFEC